MNTLDIYRKLREHHDVKIATRAKRSLMLHEKLASTRLQLRWPAPPLDENFDAKLEREFRYQLEWSQKMIELSAALTEQEQLELKMPQAPYTEESTVDYLSRYKHIVSRRSLWIKVFCYFRTYTRKIRHTLPSRLVSNWKELAFGIEVVEVSQGSFTMGRRRIDDIHRSFFWFGPEEKTLPPEKPRHKVRIHHNMIVMKYPVTQKIYREVIGKNPSTYSYLGDDHPVEGVNWYDAVHFANALSLLCGLDCAYQINGTNIVCRWDSHGWRLPTEAEWEYCAKGGKNFLYSGSSNIDDVSWHYKKSSWHSGTRSVGLKKKNAFGLYDMSGNVAEWCWDWYSSDYYVVSPKDDPLGPENGTSKVTRGGSWGCWGVGHQNSWRGYQDPLKSDEFTGFRLVRRIG